MRGIGKKLGLLGLGIGGLCLTQETHAQAIPQNDLNKIEQQQNEIQRRNETLRRLIEMKNKSLGKKKPVVTPEPELPELPDGQTCFQSESIELKGSTLLSNIEKARLLAPYLSRCITLAQVDELLRSITNLYTDKGYVTTRGFVPPQDIADGSLELTIVEGFVEGYELHDDKSRKNWRLKTAFPGTLDRPLNLRDIEQGLDQINRLKSNNAKMKLEPGSRQGATMVKIENQSSKPWHVTMGFDNSGKIATGVQQATGSLGIDDLLGINDYLSFSWSKDTKAGDPQHSRSLSGFWSVPLGYWTLSSSHSFYDHASKINGTAASYISSGYSRTHKGEVDVVVHRNKESKTNSSLFLRQHTAASFIGEDKLDSSSYRLTSIGWTLGHEDKLWGGIASAKLTMEKGIRALWAAEDEGITNPATPRAQFLKSELDLSYYKPFDVFGQKLTYTGNAHAQWSPMTLYGADQISIGGESSVRGFKESTLGGDQGLYLQNTLSWALPKTGYDIPDKLFGTFAPFIGFDMGALENDAKDSTERGVLSGYAIGLKTSGGMFNLSGTYARPIRSPAHLDERHHEVYLKAELGF
ncbi:ShlB/FhaC/HecB family hemolysin secretion/activation protein [Terasakiella sp. SH-1]|uniref:ShlB/FhaC/HecB family hemolysin secretion/activation protein n=1 Tax=Terasakiella sp. SH-1 TaxID=2560057 RepID=UPI0010734D44|nr:ShlB/FhaC/HecB family hemolysin secretion/activation protein [Terasakiella sp. SH-1]